MIIWWSFDDHLIIVWWYSLVNKQTNKQSVFYSHSKVPGVVFYSDKDNDCWQYICFKCQIVFPWKWTLYFLTSLLGPEGPECVGPLDLSRDALSDFITRETLCLVLPLERRFVWFDETVKSYFYKSEHCISSRPYRGWRVQSVLGILIFREALCLVLSPDRRCYELSTSSESNTTLLTHDHPWLWKLLWK